MHLHAGLIVLASALQLGTVFAQADSCPTQLKTYQPAQAYCTIRYPPAPATVTVTVVPTTSGAQNPTSTASASQITSAAGSSTSSGRTATITSMVEKTVTSCNLLELATNCKPILPTGRPWGKRSEEEEYYAMAMAEYENDLEKRQFGGFNFSNNPAFTWLSVLAKGSDSVKSVCSCIQTPSKTVTTTVTAKATGN